MCVVASLTDDGVVALVGAALILKLKIPPQLNSKHQTYWFLIVICGFDPNNDESVAALINVLFSDLWSIFLFH